MQARLAISPGRAASVAVLVLLLGACAGTRGGPVPRPMGPIVTDRPDFTESAEVIAPTHVQVEGGYTVSGDGPAHEHALGELLVRVGLVPHAELRLTSGYVVTTRAAEAEGGMVDASVGAKVGLIAAPRGALPALSVIAASSVPSGARAFRDERPTPEVKVVLAWELPRGTGFGVNLNTSRPADARGRFAAHAWSATVGHDVAGRVGAYAELFGIAEERDADELRYVNAGLTFAVHDALQLDVRAGTRLGVVAGRGFFMGVGAARRW